MISNNMIRKLPEEIKQHILSYSMNPQPIILCQDICNFHSTLNYLYDLYYRIYIVNFHEDEPEDKLWMINDLLGYMNEYYPMNAGFKERFYEIIHRSYTCKNIFTVPQFIKYLNNCNVFRQIHVIWGLFTPEERNNFMHNAFKPAVDDHIGQLEEEEEEEEEEDWDF